MRYPLSRLWLVLGLLLLLAGCVTVSYKDRDNTPNLNQETIKQNIICGQTTKQDVLKVFGDPKTTSVTSSSGKQIEVWVYSFIESTTQGSAFSGKYNTVSHISFLSIIFNQDGVVTNYTATSSNPAGKTIVR